MAGIDQTSKPLPPTDDVRVVTYEDLLAAKARCHNGAFPNILAEDWRQLAAALSAQSPPPIMGEKLGTCIKCGKGPLKGSGYCEVEGGPICLDGCWDEVKCEERHGEFCGHLAWEDEAPALATPSLPEGLIADHANKVPEGMVTVPEAGAVSEDLKLDALEKGFAAGREECGDLVGLPVRNLRLRAGDATHQHFKGGLYRLLGPVMDARTGAPMLIDWDQPLVAYLHCYPYERQVWVRAKAEWEDEVERPGYSGPRFRRIA